MGNFNSYWPVYKNLEEETLQLTKYINFDDNQMGVYSMHIADLIMKIVVEIESLSKELYKSNGGPDVYDDNGNMRDLYFDTDCINYLNTQWNICEREIIVSCASFNFNNSNNKIIKPLHNANKRGTSSSKWNKAYQAVKHDRRNNLKKGNIENLISALGALYILNIYYKDEVYQYKSNGSFDNRLGSDIFAATFADATLTAINEDDSDNSIDSNEKLKLSSALCIVKFDDKSWEEMHDALAEYNSTLIDGITKEPEFKRKLSMEIADKGESEIGNIFNSLVKDMQIEYIRKHPPYAFGNKLNNAKKEVILNKGKNIYTSKQYKVVNGDA